MADDDDLFEDNESEAGSDDNISVSDNTSDNFDNSIISNLSEAEAHTYTMLISFCKDWAPSAELFHYLYKNATLQAKMILSGIKEYLDTDSYEYCFNNLLLHYVIVNPLSDTLYKNYGIEGKDVIISSASNSSSSTSMQSFKSLEEGNFMMLDLIRTPFGKFVYEILEQINPLVAVL